MKKQSNVRGKGRKKGKVEQEQVTQKGDTTKKKGDTKKEDLKLALCEVKKKDRPVARALLFSK